MLFSNEALKVLDMDLVLMDGGELVCCYQGAPRWARGPLLSEKDRSRVMPQSVRMKWERCREVNHSAKAICASRPPGGRWSERDCQQGLWKQITRSSSRKNRHSRVPRFAEAEELVRDAGERRYLIGHAEKARH